MDNFITIIVLHDLESTSFTDLLSELAGSFMLRVIFSEVFSTAAEVRALKNLVEALKSVLVNLTPSHFLHTALALIVTGDLQLLELVDNKGMSLTGFEAFKVAARTSENIFLLPLLDTRTAEINSAIRAFTGVLENVLTDDT